VKHCKDQDIEIYDLKLEFNSVNICVSTIYRPLAGNFNYFLHRRDIILHILYMPILDFIICGDTNINYLIESERKNQLDSLSLSCHLLGIINYPTKVQNTSVTPIGNIFTDISHMENYTITPIQMFCLTVTLNY
jgi:hypothetical protein